MRASSFSKVAVLVMLLGGAGCSPGTEIDRPGTWKPTGANDANLQAMIADPRDLHAGAATSTNRGSNGVRAVNRLLADRRRPLLNVTTSMIGGGGGGGGESDSGGGGGGGGSGGGGGGAAP